MTDNNLPMDCQGNGAHLPWNEPEPEECPKCGCSMTMEDSYFPDLVCDDSECNGVIYGQNDAPDEDNF